MSEFTGSYVGQPMSDREIAEDILAGQKYLSNYYYAPAILEAGDAALRSSLQEIHASSVSAAKDVFDYMHAKGWYPTRQADDRDITDLRNAANESRRALSNQSTMGGTDMSMNQGQQGWTGTQNMEGRSGMGPSSLSQGVRWGGEPSWGQSAGGMGGMGVQQFGQQQVNLPDWTRGAGSQGNYGSSQGNYGSPQGNATSYGWTGTQYGEGQSGYGPSSLSQGVQWGGEPSWSGGFGSSAGGAYQGGQQVSLPSWAKGAGGQSNFAFQQGGIGPQSWTGTQYGEGQSGYGPSSLSQGARWGGQQSGYGYGQQGYGGQQSAMSGPGPHTWRSSIQTGSPGWTGTQYGEGQSGYGPSSLGNYPTGNWQAGSMGQRQGSQGFSQGI